MLLIKVINAGSLAALISVYAPISSMRLLTRVYGIPHLLTINKIRILKFLLMTEITTGRVYGRVSSNFSVLV